MELSEMTANQVSLQSFKIKDGLNNKFWVDGKINSRVRLRLLDIADDFVESLAVNWVKPTDIIFTGSLANYNWSKYSDVDLHIQLDFKKVYDKKEFVQDYFDTKKELWLRGHDKLKIFGYPVEVYVEDSNDTNPSSGRYSLKKNKWLTEPNDFQDATLNGDYIKRKSAEIMTKVDKIERNFDKEKDDDKCDKYGNQIQSLFKQLKNLRAEGLKSKKKEMSSGNIIYKVMRRMGYFDKMWKIINQSYDKSNSIKYRPDIMKENFKRHKKKQIILSEEQFNEFFG